LSEVFSAMDDDGLVGDALAESVIVSIPLELPV
jgi:hypothetical protein